MKSLTPVLVLVVVGVIATLVVANLPTRFNPDTALVVETSELTDADLVNPKDVADPTTGAADLPAGYRQVFPRDAIAPVYSPSFANGTSIDWDDDSLIIGIEIDGKSKAYPVSFLNRREMVIDRLAGIPILVTW